jgi:nitroimidazol reductase NimA-like FMN-containing flavoprotein (pyridoxamine 5'-phosphate oxidase superfamily)
MEPHGETQALVKRLLDSQRFTVLSTQSETGPYCSLVAFWSAEDLGHVTFATLRDTRKFGNLAAHPQVALLFDDRSNRDTDVQEGMAVTATGTARELTAAAARAAAAAGFLAKHPHLAEFVASPDCALVRVDVDVYYVVTRFQNVVELRVRD